jgi:hypothetical protein
MPSLARALVATVAVGAVVAAVAAGVRHSTAPDPAPSPGVPAPPGAGRAEAAPERRMEPADGPRLSAPADPIRVPGASLFGWTLLDHITGAMAGSANSATVTNTVESMIKPWIAADHLRRLADDDRRPTRAALDELTLMIVDSHDPAAEKYFHLGGTDAVTRRLVSVCDLDRVRMVSAKWSFTEMTPRDAARYGRCLADGRAAGPEWTVWILDTMKKVRGDVGDQVSNEVQGGRWGIIDGLPPELAREVAIKNGWTSYVDGWHVNCLAVHPEWTLAVMLRMATLRAAAKACEEVAKALVVDA